MRKWVSDFFEIRIVQCGELLWGGVFVQLERWFEVVQIYISLPDIGLTTPRLQLRGFTKARDIAPGESETITVKLDKYAVSWWDAVGHQWKAVPGTYGVHVGKSSAAMELEGEFVLEKGFTWVGL